MVSSLKPGHVTPAHGKNLTHIYVNKIKNNDAYITATFWAFFSIGRFASIFVAKRLSPSYMIMLDLVSASFPKTYFFK